MTPQLLFIGYCLAITSLALIIWYVAKLNLKRQRVNNLNYEAEITVLGQKAIYCYRVGKYEHRIKLSDDTFHIVDVDEIKIK